MTSVAVSLAVATGCGNNFQKIDRRVDQLLVDSSATLGPDAMAPAYSLPISNGRASDSEMTAERPPTVNPPASEINFKPVPESGSVLDRLANDARQATDVLLVDLPFALAQATGSSREYVFAQEEFVLAALRLLIERHLWGPRFFNDTSLLVTGDADNGLYDTSLRLVNDFSVTQRLPYGGEVSARALAQSVEDLHVLVADEEVQDASIILNADLPLLRGAGTSAREERIQAERNLIYAARDFEDFRREFVVEIIEDFLSLVVQQQAVANAERQVDRLRLVEERERSLYEAGRTPRFQSALAEQSTVRAQDDLNSRRENYRLAVDRFKLRLNIPIDQPVVIVPTELELPVPLVDIQQAVQTAMTYRLDLQTQRDVQVDAQRLVGVARNSVLPDLDLTGTLVSTTDPTRERAGVAFDLDETSFSTGIRFGLPLDREIERLNVRRAQIELERAKRDLDLLRDNVVVQVRSAVRDIDRAIFTLEIQERSIEIGRQRIASIEAAPDRASARDASDAANEFARAQDRRDSARRDLQVAILRYLLETGQLRVDSHGFIRPLNGMEINGEKPISIPALPSLGQADPAGTLRNDKLPAGNSNLAR